LADSFNIAAASGAVIADLIRNPLQFERSGTQAAWIAGRARNDIQVPRNDIQAAHNDIQAPHNDIQAPHNPRTCAC
jgi:hypothetical protein